MMKDTFFSHKEQIQEANRDLQEALDNYFMKHSEDIRRQLMEAGASPQKAEAILVRIKREQQVEMIKEFKTVLREVALESRPQT